MRERKELNGQEFGELTVIAYSDRKTPGNSNTHWLCKCSCGRYLLVRRDNLIDGRTSRCSECKTGGGVPSVFCEVEEDDQVGRT